MTNHPADRFRLLRERVLQQPRIAGTYILEGASLPPDANCDEFLREFTARHGFGEPDVGDDEWKHAEVFREDARNELVQTLMGGLEIGHSRWDVAPADAAALADAFLAIFDGQARFFCSGNPSSSAGCLAPQSRPEFSDYIFGGGCIAVDRCFAGIFWVLDND